MLLRMLKRFNSLSLRHKMLLIVMPVSALSLFMAFTAIVMNEKSSLMKATEESISTAAAVIGSNSVTAIVFDDKKTAEETLSSLSSSPHIVAAAVYDGTGRLFATYIKDKGYMRFVSPVLPDEGHEYRGGYLTASKGISLDNKIVGGVAVTTDLKDVYASTKRHMVYIAGIMVLAFSGVIVLSILLQRVIINPVLRLNDIMGLVAKTKDYSIRTAKSSDDEIGSLAEGFNDMLSHIQERDAVLEETVESRTSELTDANIQLRYQLIELRKLKDSLYENEERLLTLINSTPDVVQFKDGEGRWLIANDAGLRLFQLEEKSYSGKKDSELADVCVFYKAALLACEKSDEAAWMKRGIYRMEEAVPQPDGTIKIYDAIKVPLFHLDGSRKGLVILARDITELKITERELRHAKDVADKANMAKRDFLAHMSHEIRTPMNAITGMISLALGTQLREEQRDYLNSIKQSADFLLDIVNDILDLSKIEAGKMEIQEIDFDLRVLVEGIFSSMSVQAKNKGIDLVYEIGPGISDVLKGDPLRLRQIIVNLLGNAIKFTERGKVDLRIEKETDPFVTLHFSVSDTGVGIPEDRCGAIFESFTQVDASTTKRYGGTGLGLSICKKLVKMMGGEIWVESKIGEGSTFHFTATFNQGKTAGEPVLEKTKASATLSLHPLNILVVEDNVLNQKVMFQLLEGSGYCVKMAQNGVEAIEALEKEDFDVVLMDIHMPDMDGFEATRLIRNPESQVKNHHVPIIAVTADTMKGDRDFCIRAGMNDYISKPFNPEDLFEKVERLSLYNPKKVSAHSKPGAQADGNVIDKRYLLDRYGDEGIVTDMLETFLEDASLRIEETRRTFESGDIDYLGLQAHSIKGSSATIGAVGLNDAASRLELAAKEGDLKKAAALFNRLEAELNKFKAALIAPASKGEIHEDTYS